MKIPEFSEIFENCWILRKFEGNPNSMDCSYLHWSKEKAQILIFRKTSHEDLNMVVYVHKQCGRSSVLI